MQGLVYYSGRKIEFALPRGWNLLSDGQEIKRVEPCPDPIVEIKRALDEPIGSPALEELAAHAGSAAILFDDLTRLTPAHLAFPEVLNRLNHAGIRDNRIAAVCARGTHASPDEEGLKKKIGNEAYGRLYPRVTSHDPRSRENVLVGRTSRGNPVEINPVAANADLVIGIGSCSPHSWAGFGGGSKIIMPGISSFHSIAVHHLTWLRNRHTEAGALPGNLFFEEANEIARLIGFRFKMDFLTTFRGEVIRVFCGDVVEEHAEAARACSAASALKVPRKSDVTISAAFPLERGNQSIKSLHNAADITKSGGHIIWVAPQPDRKDMTPFAQEVGTTLTANEYHRRLVEGQYPESLQAAGLSFMCTVVETKTFLDRFSITHVTDGLDPKFVESMGMKYAASMEEAIRLVEKDLPKADVTILPYGGMVLPRISS